MEKLDFYQTAMGLINAETKKLDDFCDALNNNKLEKKAKITEYKCAKYRYAGITNVWAMMYMNHRVGKRNCQTNHLAPKFNEIFVTFPSYVEIYNQAPDDEKTDFALYYGALAFSDYKIAELKSNILSAGDWERVELEERIGGIEFAKACINEAWQKRGVSV